MYHGTYHKMNEETRKLLTMDHDEETVKIILEQVEYYESKQIRKYTINYPKGEYYVENGLFYGQKKYV